MDFFFSFLAEKNEGEKLTFFSLNSWKPVDDINWKISIEKKFVKVVDFVFGFFVWLLSFNQL